MITQETGIQFQLSKVNLSANSTELCKQENKAQSFELLTERSLLIAPTHMNTYSDWMAVSVLSMGEHCSYNNQLCFCRPLQGAFSHASLCRTYNTLHSCADRFALHYSVSFVPMMLIFCQVSRLE